MSGSDYKIILSVTTATMSHTRQEKFLTCSISGWATGGCPKRNITTSCPFVIPDVNNNQIY